LTRPRPSGRDEAESGAGRCSPSPEDPETPVGYRDAATGLRSAEVKAGSDPQEDSREAYRRLWGSSRKDLPDVDVEGARRDVRGAVEGGPLTGRNQARLAGKLARRPSGILRHRVESVAGQSHRRGGEMVTSGDSAPVSSSLTPPGADRLRNELRASRRATWRRR
jgi:hypothetical protein